MTKRKCLEPRFCERLSGTVLWVASSRQHAERVQYNNNNNNNNNKPLCWDVTVACPVANSYIHTAIGSASAVAEMAATGKSTKYGALESQYCFQPIALESLGPMNSDARHSFFPTLVAGFPAVKKLKAKAQVLGIAPLNMRSVCQRRFTIVEVVTNQHWL